ncbi:methanobactin biosynthesis protein MbnB [Methylocystis parvus]|uniref:Methanobactin biosynthesis cassette protein MbnB n=1 Tax=Methylocystis parvus TaxID=134 RepID=A0A6B8M7E2_9HYPH|nr:methanobactin biosynthesis protein MbnB [Methylocystis parvus]QGM98418.1 methanobactin biosynthesis cassette protein MbnB [Methylocystis parvus]WBK01249.1 methanobactin biosynthesis cassette protein MbnB [Methylocystis parvus OBBP]
MRIGFNFTLTETADMVRRMLAEGHIDYCEFLIDNFIGVPPAELARAFDCPVGFHIMFSEFIDADQETLEDFAKRIRVLIRDMQPLYVSDHGASFTHRGVNLFHLGELDYVKDYDRVRTRVDLWQEMLGQRLFIENYPSILEGGWEAPRFFERLIADTGASVLFDASNAVCANLNCGAPLEAWDKIIAETPHFHVAGYSRATTPPYVIHDSHSEELSEKTLDFLRGRRDLFDKPNATMTYERDGNIDYESIVIDLKRLRDIFSTTSEDQRHESNLACAH